MSWLGLDMDFSVSLARDPFNRVADGLYLGARPTPERAPALKEAGVTHVVSCLNEEDRDKVAFMGADFSTLFIPLRDGMNEDIAAAFPEFFEFADGLDAAGGQSVLVHCEAGVSRSATLVTALLMRRRGRAFFETYLDVRARRQEVLPNIGFASQLQRFERELGLAGDDESPSSLARYLHEVCAVPAELGALQQALHQHDDDAPEALCALFGGEIPRVVQGVRL